MYYRLSRFSKTHTLLRKSAYAILWKLPDKLKYGGGSIWRRFRLPYRLLRPGDVAIQIGAPWDILRAGRSRAAYFAYFVGSAGRVVVVEPAQDNVCALRDFADKHRYSQMEIVPIGAWSKTARLRFLLNVRHPASSLVEEVCGESARDRSNYEATEIDVESVDSLVEQCALDSIKLLSITTNGSEIEILKGATESLRNIEFVSTITDAVEPFLAKYGFVRFGHDDRGFTFRRQ